MTFVGMAKNLYLETNRGTRLGLPGASPTHPMPYNVSATCEQTDLYSNAKYCHHHHH